MSLLLLPAGLARSQEDCLSPEPLLSVTLDSITLQRSPIFVGEWKLPASEYRRDLLTEARVRLQLVKDDDTGNWQGQLEFAFPDPKPYGIPYSFQKAELSWENHRERNAAAIDWARECSGPGRSMYPGQSWSGTIDLWGSSSMDSISHPLIRIWGTRN
ncbi:MAG: hypothetical protein NDJ89_07855 [Oligoflexia bacterium]|nr:hypothetical protein [Oligoflexia bacterium]